MIREYPARDQFRVGPTSTFDDLSFPLELERLESEWLRVTDQESGRDLQFRVVVGRHGFLRGLEGRTTDGGEWPRTWSVNAVTIPTPPRVLIDLPSADAARAFQSETRGSLAKWIGVPLSGEFEFHPPASPAQIAARERTIGGQFPTGFRDFLSITDGLDSKAITIHGHEDVYELDNPFHSLVLIAWDSDDVDDFVVAVSLESGNEAVYRIDVHDDDARPVSLAEDFASFLRDLIGAHH